MDDIWVRFILLGAFSSSHSKFGFGFRSEWQKKSRERPIFTWHISHHQHKKRLNVFRFQISTHTAGARRTYVTDAMLANTSIYIRYLKAIHLYGVPRHAMPFSGFLNGSGLVDDRLFYFCFENSGQFFIYCWCCCRWEGHINCKCHVT